MSNGSDDRKMDRRSFLNRTTALAVGRAPRTCKYPEELLALKDIDAVLISTPEHSHSPLLKVAAEAGILDHPKALASKAMASDEKG